MLVALEIVLCVLLFFFCVSALAQSVVRDELERKQCELLVSIINAKMSLYAPENREPFNGVRVCKLFFWKDHSASKSPRGQEKEAAEKVAVEEGVVNKVVAGKAAVEKTATEEFCGGEDSSREISCSEVHHRGDPGGEGCGWCDTKGC